ncbi:MAG: hypothetical protein LCH52_08210 [Bacteroidetes bacterium]|nr:hypothetical protein [Bacteroidota bacterium]
MTELQIRAQLKKYLPAFIDENGTLDAIFLSVAKELKKLYDESDNLVNAPFTGRGLLLTCSEYGNFIGGELIDEGLINSRLENIFTILRSRGSEDTILSDLESLHNEEFCGWENITPPGNDLFGIVLDWTYYTDEYYFLDLHKLIVIDSGDGIVPLTDVEKNLIQTSIVPSDTTVIFK